MSVFPDVDAYSALTVTFWVPDLLFPHLVPEMPCGRDKNCKGAATAASHSRHSRRIQGISRTELLVSAQYECRSCKLVFQATSDIAMSRLPVAVQEAFPFVLTEAAGITKEYLWF